MHTPPVRRIALVATLLAFAPYPARSQPNFQYATPYAINTLAGTTSSGSENGTDARFYQPSGVVIDTVGNLYITESGNHTIRKRTPEGVVSTLAGAATQPGTADGNGDHARFTTPVGLALDSGGSLYVADSDNHVIRKITPAGLVTTLAGSVRNRGGADGIGVAARFNRPLGVAIDAAGNIYVADTINHAIRKITLSAQVTTLAGLIGTAGDADGVGTNARFNAPEGIAVDASGNVFVADTLNQTVRRISPTGETFTIAGLAGSAGHIDGTGSSARLAWPTAVTVAPSGHLYVVCRNQTLRRISPSGVVTTLAGTPDIPGDKDGTGSTARFNKPRSVTVDAADNVYIADWNNNNIRKVTIAGVVSTIAGLSDTASSGHVDATGNSARFALPLDVAVGANGTLFVADSSNLCVRVVSPTGVVTTLAGTPGVLSHVDGPAASARFGNIAGIAIDAADNLYVADASFSVIRKITPAGEVSTLAGSPGAVGLVDGAGSAARFNRPGGLDIDASGTLYVMDRYNNAVRKITPGGVVTTLVDNRAIGDASEQLLHPMNLTVDQAGNVYVCDTIRNAIRKVTPEGVMTTFAGQGGRPGLEDGTGINARFVAPTGIATDGTGNVYVADNGVGLIRRITPEGLVTTLAGNFFNGSRADGIGESACFDFPFGITVGATGTIYVTDSHSIRKGRPAIAPVITAQPQGATVTAGDSVQFSVTASGAPDPTYQWFLNGNPFSGATTSALSFSNARSSDAGDYTVVITNALGSVTSTKATLTVKTVTSPPTTGGGSTSGGGGGGAPSVWFVSALLILGWVRFLRSANGD